MKISRALITGASSGIGKEMAYELAKKKVNLILVARRLDLLETIALELRQYGIQVETIGLDLSDSSTPSALLKQVTAEGKIVDFLINNAGIGPFRSFLDADLVSHQSVVQLNISTLTEMSYLFGEHMLKHGKEAIILNVASVASFQAVPKFAVYSASKFYVRIFSQILRHELRNSNISVSCLCPGGTATEFLDKNNQKIKGSFSPLMSANRVAQAGIEGALKRKAVIVPGLFNKLSCLIPRLIPTGWSISLAEWGMALAVVEQEKKIIK